MKRVVHTKLGIYVLITTVFMKRVVYTKLGIYVLITTVFMKRVVYTKLGIYVLITTHNIVYTTRIMKTVVIRT
jgi:hypothetical protein